MWKISAIGKICNLSCYVLNKKSIAAVIIVALLGAGLFVGGMITGIGHERQKREFDSRRWKAAGRHDKANERFEMLGDFLSTHNICGMQKAEIAQLLGPPSPDYPYASGEMLCYPMGEGFLDKYWLILTVENDKVASYAVYYI